VVVNRRADKQRRQKRKNVSLQKRYKKLQATE
jgi:hypothetical protein